MITRIRFRDLRGLLKRGGWIMARNGNHQTWRHPNGGTLTIPSHPQTDVIQGRIASRILRTQPEEGN